MTIAAILFFSGLFIAFILIMLVAVAQLFLPRN